MNQLEAQGENAEQIKYWNGQAGENWTERNDEMDAMLRPLGATAIERAAVMGGEHILDIGCGCGGTTLDMVSCVGTSGRVLGVDISEPMLALAHSKAQRLPENLQGTPSFQLADASTYDFPIGS
ncbi:MAG: class I SAM-dependent methyltransferase, partial [Proteobacteria bacterium]|nr:class I SAM-dependent methyltransferase [Pseudomonadota bacterium]